YINPAVSDAKGLSNKNEEYSIILSKAQELAQKRDEVMTQYNNIPQADLDKLNKIIPTTFDSVLFANDLNNLAVQYGLSIKSIKASSADPVGQDGVTDGSQSPFKTNIV